MIFCNFRDFVFYTAMIVVISYTNSLITRTLHSSLNSIYPAMNSGSCCRVRPTKGIERFFFLVSIIHSVIGRSFLLSF